MTGRVYGIFLFFEDRNGYCLFPYGRDVLLYISRRYFKDIVESSLRKV